MSRVGTFPLLPVAAKLVGIVPHARSSQISTHAPVTPEGSDQWSVGVWIDVVVVVVGAMSSGGEMPPASTSTGESLAASANGASAGLASTALPSSGGLASVPALTSSATSASFAESRAPSGLF